MYMKMQVKLLELSYLDTIIETSCLSVIVLKPLIYGYFILLSILIGAIIRGIKKAAKLFVLRHRRSGRGTKQILFVNKV